MYKFKLKKRTQSRSEVGPSEDLEFEVFDSTPLGEYSKNLTVFAHMESDDLFPELTGDKELDAAFWAFIEQNFDILHYYMD